MGGGKLHGGFTKGQLVIFGIAGLVCLCLAAGGIALVSGGAGTRPAPEAARPPAAAAAENVASSAEAGGGPRPATEDPERPPAGQTGVDKPAVSRPESAEVAAPQPAKETADGDEEAPAEPAVADTSLPADGAEPQEEPVQSQEQPRAPPQISLRVAPESGAPYDRAEYGDHRSGLCRREMTGAFTGVAIDRCNVDHVVALKEAHESGGHAWSADKKRAFSQDPANHLAARACVNQSKCSRDAAEWTPAWIAQSSACGGGYRLTAAGYCKFIRITVAVKLKYGLSADRDEKAVLDEGCAETGAPSPPGTPPAGAPEKQPRPQTGRSCVHWHAGNPKHAHPGSGHDGTHKSGKCKGF